MDLRKARIDDKLYNIISKEEYNNNKEAYSICNTAIDNARGFIVPLRNKTDKRPGFYDCGLFLEKRGDHNIYKEENISITDLGDIESMKELIEKQEKIRDINKSILENPEDIYKPIYLENDTSEMKMFKDAIKAKNFNLKSYEKEIEDETGSSFNNDKRILEKSSISFGKMKDFGNAFDMKITLTIEDKNSNVANPMKCVISKVINEGDK